MEQRRECRILVVEDNRDILAAVSLLLEGEGFDVVTAESVPEAAARLGESLPDLIVTDLHLPGTTGLEFIHQIRRTADYDMLPIIAISAYDRRYLEAAVRAGANAALHKPEDLDVLAEAVSLALAKRPGAARAGTKSH